MAKNLIGEKIKTLRNSKGYSQDHLSALAQLNLRTVQRIECGETEPRGDTLNRLAKALEVAIDEFIVTDTVSDDSKGNLSLLNLLGLGCLVYNIPFIGLMLPMFYWLAKKNEFADAKTEAHKIINFQVTMAVLQFVLVIGGLLFKIQHFNYASTLISVGIFLPVFNIGMIIFNGVRIRRHQPVIFWPAIPVLR